MTTARPQAVRTKLALLLTVLALAGCRDATTTYRIDGARGEFCVPHSVDITPPRPGQNDMVHGSFALRGPCSENREECSTANGLVSLAVMDQSSFAGRRFMDFPAHTYIPEIAGSQIDQAQRLDATLLAIPDPAEMRAWFIWHQAGLPHPTVEGEDELMATCSFSSVHQSYFCDRRLRGPDYIGEYTFMAGERLPTSFASRDKYVLGEIERLRCE